MCCAQSVVAAAAVRAERVSGPAGQSEERAWSAAGPAVMALINAYSINGSVGYMRAGMAAPSVVGAAHDMRPACCLG